MRWLLPLNRNLQTEVDEADFLRFADQRWSADGPRGEARVFYAVGTVRGRKCYLHQAILGLRGRKIRVDHRNGDTLDNRRHNLRRATAVTNGQNRRKQCGVSYDPHRPATPWVARIQIKYRTISLGRFRTKRAALEARLTAEIKHFGEFSHAASRRR